MLYAEILQYVDWVDQIWETMLTFHFLVVVAVAQDKNVKANIFRCIHFNMRKTKVLLVEIDMIER